MMIGIHVRMHEADLDWPVVSPGGLSRDTRNGSSQADVFGVGASQQDFMKILGPVRDKFLFSLEEPAYQRSARVVNEAGTVDEPNTLVRKTISLAKYFIASNDWHVKQALADYLGEDAIVVNSEAGRQQQTASVTGQHLFAGRSSADDIVFALTELLLLSRSHLIVHTHGSSFGTVAGRFKQVPTVSVWKSHALYTNSVYLPNCGVTDYFDEDETTKIAEIEGVSPRSGRQLRLKQCPHLNEFGVHDLYCVSRNE
jgi:hypothetical protein